MKPETNARRREIRSLLLTDAIPNQGELRETLAARGFDVTQATISRDLDAIGAERVRENGGFTYRVSGQESQVNGAPAMLHVAVEEFVQSAVTSQNLIVLKVPPGAAQFVASRIDAAEIGGALGTIAGDDTILVIADERIGSQTVLRRLSGMEQT